MTDELTPEQVNRLRQILRKQFYMKNGKAGEVYLSRQYDLTRRDVAAMLLKQNGMCDDCGRDLNECNWCIDHNHKTAGNRGILCYRCNTAIRDIDLMFKHVAYLRKHGEKI